MFVIGWSDRRSRLADTPPRGHMESDARVDRIEAALELLRRRDVSDDEREWAVQGLSVDLPMLVGEHRRLGQEVERLADMNTRLLLQRDTAIRVLGGVHTAFLARSSRKAEPNR